MCPSKGLLFWPTTPWARETNIRPQQVFVGGDAMRDAQADVPSAKRLRAQLAFKNSMVHGILQFTPSIAFCYVLHRCVSRDIRCRESFMIYKEARFNAITANGKAWNKQFLSLYFLGTFRAGVG